MSEKYGMYEGVRGKEAMVPSPVTKIVTRLYRSTYTISKHTSDSAQKLTADSLRHITPM